MAAPGRRSPQEWQSVIENRSRKQFNVVSTVAPDRPPLGQALPPIGMVQQENEMSNPLHCPNGCGVLGPLSLRGVALQRCPKCAGLYLDRQAVVAIHELSKTTLQRIDDAIRPKSRRASLAGRLKKTPRKCPNCATLMLPYTVYTTVLVTLDHCATCDGIWADDHELAAASEPIEPEADVHFNADLPKEFRDKMTQALYERSSHYENAGHLHDQLAAILPYLASWLSGQ